MIPYGHHEIFFLDRKNKTLTNKGRATRGKEEDMYRNLQKLLKERQISAPKLAPVIGTTNKTALNKIKGDTDFTVGEAKRVRLIFPEYDFDYLFASDDETCDETVPGILIEQT